MMFRRHAERLLREALRDTRVVAIAGPRQSGKTTLARLVASGDFDYLTVNRQYGARNSTPITPDSGSNLHACSHVGLVDDAAVVVSADLKALPHALSI